MTTSEQERPTSRLARFARLGFTDAARADAIAARAGIGFGLLTEIAGSADPDLALESLVHLVDATANSSAADDRHNALALDLALRADVDFRRRLFAVLGSSAALGDHLATHPADWVDLADPGFDDSRPTWLGLRTRLTAAVVGKTGPAAEYALRSTYRRLLMRLAARDLTGQATVDDVAAELADLASATLDAALVVATAELGADAAACRLAVIGMGKCGGRELNYISDVDVVFVAEAADDADAVAALRTAGQLAAGIIRVCASIWEVDTALRPEGKMGPLVRTLASHVAYYHRWAKTWEFQALLKARPVAGDFALGQAYVDALRPMVWTAAGREHFVEDVQAMRRRVEASLPAADAEREIKLGPGGLRDVEFAVQLLQLVHGRADDTLRSATTLNALADLAAGGYVGRRDAVLLADAYRFLRTLEHRLQLHHLRRTHLLPIADADIRRLGRGMGFRRDPVGELHAEHTRHAREVRRLHEKLFYRPLLAAVARLPGDEARLSLDAAAARLEALGYTDPESALRHLETLTSGLSRRAAIQRTLLPVMLSWFADAPDPDGGLLAFRQVSDSLGDTHWYLRLLRDEGAAAQHLALVLASGRYAAELFLRAPESVAMMADSGEGSESPHQLRPRPAADLRAELLSAVRRYDDAEAAVSTARGLRRRELLRVACADLLGLLDTAEVGQALSDVTSATLDAVLDAVIRKVEADRGGGPLPMKLAIIGMGRLGGGEQGYGSDADVLFVHEPVSGADEAQAAAVAHLVANEVRRLLAVPAPEPPVDVDADLRPEGRQGPLTRSLGSYVAYYARWSKVWESQALLRAAPVAGDADLGARFIAAIDPIRWPPEGLAPADVREIRRIKARVEKERLPRGADPTLNTKLGRGGLSDVEWTVQLLQLRFAGGVTGVAGLRSTSTLQTLEAARVADLIDAGDAETLASAWRLATRVRNALVLARGKPADSIPTDFREVVRIARLVGYSPQQSGDFLELYRRVTRRSRAVVDKIFYA
ncbi:MAG TPA: bifunctional [glutamine synthetase] adenylyltransferase/[glutamine synthetase]-adenylyl-L-tyrosine phosphorylase [Acidothermaceae bacterium]